MTKRRQAVRIVVALAAAAALVFGLLRLGQFARLRLDAAGHYRVPFAELQCVAPPGLSRDTFLAEVQYLGGLPDQLDLLDAALTARLAAAFALHPWVERVEGVSVRPAGVRLLLRTPVLAVTGRAVDGHGILLPAGTPTEALLPVTNGLPPKGPAGAPWGDERVEAAAKAAAALAPYQATLGSTSVTALASGPVFAGRVRVLWGSGDAATKLDRLRAALADPDKPPKDVDLR